ncbi:MAG: PHP domain-containing protein, partial [bacterium]|nr:PHP domain-containing protein [bacterium]
MFDYHVHLERGPLSVEWVQQFLAQAARTGVTEVGIVEHLHLFREAQHIFHNNLVGDSERRSIGDFLKLIEDVKAQGLPVKWGLEVDFIPGAEAKIKKFLETLPLDFVIGSVHWIGDWPFDYEASTWNGRNVPEVYSAYYDLLA